MFTTIIITAKCYFISIQLTDLFVKKKKKKTIWQPRLPSVVATAIIQWYWPFSPLSCVDDTSRNSRISREHDVTADWQGHAGEERAFSASGQWCRSQGTVSIYTRLHPSVPRGHTCSFTTNTLSTLAERGGWWWWGGGGWGGTHRRAVAPLIGEF